VAAYPYLLVSFVSFVSFVSLVSLVSARGDLLGFHQA